MWFGTNLGVGRHDGHHFRVFRRANTLPAPLSNDYVLALAEDGAGDIWLGTADGLNRFHPPSETFSVFRHDAGDPGSLAGNIINHLAVWRARPGFMWVSTADGGLNCFNLKTGRCKRFRPGASRPGSDVRKEHHLRSAEFAESILKAEGWTQERIQAVRRWRQRSFLGQGCARFTSQYRVGWLGRPHGSG